MENQINKQIKTHNIIIFVFKTLKETITCTQVSRDTTWCTVTFHKIQKLFTILLPTLVKGKNVTVSRYDNKILLFYYYEKQREIPSRYTMRTNDISWNIISINNFEGVMYLFFTAIVLLMYSAQYTHNILYNFNTFLRGNIGYLI